MAHIQKGDPWASNSRSRLNLFSKLLLVIFVISGALVRQTWVKRERDSKGLEITIFDMYSKYSKFFYVFMNLQNLIHIVLLKRQ